MKHLMELPSWNIAVITWWEDVDFPVKEKNRYNLLLRSRTHYPEHMTPNEDKELQELAGVQGERTIRIGKIEIVNMLPVDCNTIPTSFSLSGADFLALQKEIEKLKEPYIGQFITLGDNWCAEVEY